MNDMISASRAGILLMLSMRTRWWPRSRQHATGAAFSLQRASSRAHYAAHHD